jgi:acetyltransferase
VVVKRDGPAHKSRDGGVVLGLADEASVRHAAARLSGPVLVAAQAAPGLELFCGMSRDADFGPVLVIGPGGAAAEILPGKEACTAPIALDEARRLIADSRVLSRAVPPAAVDTVARIIVAIGRLAVEHPEVAEMDINPLVVGERDVVAVDALVVVSA